MFLVAAHELAGLVSADRLRVGGLYPPIAGLRAVARAIAGVPIRTRRSSRPSIAMWSPDYVPFEPGD